MNKEKFKMNLQLFSDSFFGQHAPEGVQNPIIGDSNADELESNIGQPDTIEDNSTNNPIEDNKDNNINDNQTEDTKDEPVEKINFNEIKSQLDTILNKINQDKTEEPEEIEEQKEPELTPEEIEKMNNEFYIKFTEKPLEALQELIDQEANKKVEPLRQYVEQMQQVEMWKHNISEFEKQNPDFKDYVDDMARIIEEDEGIRTSKNPLEVAYKLAKSERLEQQLQQTLTQNNKPIDEIIKEQDTLKQLLSNKEIKSMIVKELMNEKEQIPQVIGSNGSEGNTSVNIGEKPKTIKDGTKAWLGY